MNKTIGKKANIQNSMAAIILLMVSGVLFIFLAMLFGYIISGFEGAGLYTGAVKSAGDSFMGAFYLFDKLMVVLLLGLVIASIVSSINIAANPLFFFVTFAFGFLFGMISFFFNYIFSQIVSQDVFASTLVFFPVTLLICTNLHWVLLMLIIVSSITLYAKKKQGQEGI
jgi:hypothetical protein